MRLPVKVMTTGGMLRGMLNDLSYFGCRLMLEEAPRPGAEVVVQWAAFEAFGIVSWTARQGCGVTFFDPVGPDTIIATRDLDDSRNAASEREDQREVARNWVLGQG